MRSSGSDNNPFFAGEGEIETCINGQDGAVGACFGRDVRGIVDRLIAERLPVETDEGEGRPSRWNTLRALRVLDWYSSAAG